MRAVPRFAALTLAALALSYVACSEVTAPDPSLSLGPTEVRGIVVTSASNPAVNDQITVSFAVKRGTEAAMIGAAAGTITFDATAFEFVAEVPASQANTVVALAAASPGTIRFASAAADGFVGENIASVTIKVLKTGAMSSIKVSLDEMTNVNGEDKKP